MYDLICYCTEVVWSELHTVEFVLFVLLGVEEEPYGNSQKANAAYGQGRGFKLP